MTYIIRNAVVLKRLLWLDCLLGGSTALAGLVFPRPLAAMLGLPEAFIIPVSIITGLYAVVACRLALQRSVSIPLLRILIAANWAWSVVSVGLLLVHFGQALALGKIFLALQIVVVGGLAWLEGRQLTGD